MHNFIIALAVGTVLESINNIYPLKPNLKWTHWCVESSVDLVHWENRYDWTYHTNFLDGSTYIEMNEHKPIEFFRLAGDTI